jgi:hypothetical protein
MLLAGDSQPSTMRDHLGGTTPLARSYRGHFRSNPASGEERARLIIAALAGLSCERHRDHEAPGTSILAPDRPERSDLS